MKSTIHQLSDVIIQQQSENRAQQQQLVGHRNSKLIIVVFEFNPISLFGSRDLKSTRQGRDGVARLQRGSTFESEMIHFGTNRPYPKTGLTCKQLR